VNIVKRTLGEILGLDPAAMNYGLKTTMNADEAVARGCALQCAMLSSRMKVKPFNILDRLPYSIVAHFDAAADGVAGGGGEGEGKEDVAVKGSSATLYKRNDELPHKPRRLTFKKKTADFTVTLTYDDSSAGAASLPAGEERVIARYTIKLPAGAQGNEDVRVTFNIDKHGCVYLQSAQMLEEIPPEPVTEESNSKEGEGKAAEGKEGEEKGATEAGPAKKRFRKTELEIVADVFSVSRDDVKASLKLKQIWPMKIKSSPKLLTSEMSWKHTFTPCETS